MNRSSINIIVCAVAVLLMAPLLVATVDDINQRKFDTAIEEMLSISDKPMPLVIEAMDEAQAIEDEIAAAEEAAYYYEPVYYAPSYSGEASDFMRQGVVYDGDTRYTWYSQRILAGGGLTELNNNGRHVEDGFVKDGDGYIAVASSDYEKGTIVDTPFGQGKVYDSGCASGTIDVYTDF